MRGCSKSPTPSTSTTFTDEDALRSLTPSARRQQSSPDPVASPVDAGPRPRAALQLPAPEAASPRRPTTPQPAAAPEALRVGLQARRRLSGLTVATPPAGSGGRGRLAVPHLGAVPPLEMGRVRADAGAGEAGGRDLCDLYDLCDGSPCSGSAGTVRRAWRRSDGSAVALKDVRCPPGEEEVREVTRREYEFMKTLSHPSIVRALAIHESAASVVVCMEYCDGGSVESHVKSHGTLSPTVAAAGALQVLQALDYMHSRRVAHRDVKPANVLLNASTTNFKLGDFNSAKQIGNHDELGSVMLTNRGTACYTAPEIHAGHMWNERVDIWSAGLSIHFMRRGRLPFDLERARVRNALTRGEAPSMDLSELGNLMGSLVRQCLEPNPRDRPPAVELLAHPVFREGPTRAVGPTAHTDDLVPACGLVWRLLGAEAVGMTRGSAASIPIRKVLTSPEAGREQGPLWCRLAERRFARDAAGRSGAPRRRRSVG